VWFQPRNTASVAKLRLKTRSQRVSAAGRTKRPPTEAALLPDGAATLLTNERIVSVELAGESRPAHREISKNLSFRSTLRRFNQTKTFCRLILAMLCAVHQLIPRSVNQYLDLKNQNLKNEDAYRTFTRPAAG
jgi:hypothetical protein